MRMRAESSFPVSFYTTQSLSVRYMVYNSNSSRDVDLSPSACSLLCTSSRSWSPVVCSFWRSCSSTHLRSPIKMDSHPRSSFQNLDWVSVLFSAVLASPLCDMVSADYSEPLAFSSFLPTERSYPRVYGFVCTTFAHRWIQQPNSSSHRICPLVVSLFLSFPRTVQMFVGYLKSITQHFVEVSCIACDGGVLMMGRIHSYHKVNRQLHLPTIREEKWCVTSTVVVS